MDVAELPRATQSRRGREVLGERAQVLRPKRRVAVPAVWVGATTVTDEVARSQGREQATRTFEIAHGAAFPVVTLTTSSRLTDCVRHHTTCEAASRRCAERGTDLTPRTPPAPAPTTTQCLSPLDADASAFERINRVAAARWSIRASSTRSRFTRGLPRSSRSARSRRPRRRSRTPCCSAARPPWRGPC